MTTVSVAIECSQRQGSVALRRSGENAITVEPLAPPPRSGDDLLPALDRLLSRAGSAPQDIATVAVSIGPGSFTGIRVAVTVARTLHLATGATLIGVPSAMVALASLAPEIDATVRLQAPHPALVVLAVKRGEFWATEAVAERDDSASSARWSVRGTPELRTTEHPWSLSPSILIADEFLPEALRAQATALGIPIHPLYLSAEGCLRAGEAQLAAQGPQSPDDLLPLYSRRPEAVRLWEARQEA